MYPLATRLSASDWTGTVGATCSSRKASHRTPGTPRLRSAAIPKEDISTARYGFASSSGEIQRLPLASGGWSLCVVSTAASGAGGCRQTSRLHRHQTHLASPPTAHLGHGTAQLWDWAA